MRIFRVMKSIVELLIIEEALIIGAHAYIVANEYIQNNCECLILLLNAIYCNSLNAMFANNQAARINMLSFKVFNKKYLHCYFEIEYEFE